jgi:serine O-acetyltransferase
VSVQRNVVWDAWRADRARYPKLAFVFERSIWAVGVLRFGHWVDTWRGRVPQLIGRIIYQALFILSETLTGISIPKSVVVGPGLRVFHSGGIVVHERAVIGANCTLRHGVTIGVRSTSGGVPVIGDNVDIGTGAMVLGDISVGNDAKIGAGALVQVNVPAGAVAFAPRAVIAESACVVVPEPVKRSTPRGRVKTQHAIEVDEMSTN